MPEILRSHFVGLHELRKNLTKLLEIQPKSRTWSADVI